jgi:hypothetical protein
MAFTLQAIIAVQGALPDALPAPLRMVSLQFGLAMVPLHGQALRALGIPSLPLTIREADAVPTSLANLCALLSQAGPLVYVEAEYFGGMGTQASAAFAHGQLAGAKVVAQDAINRALQFLGVSKGDAFDEFEAVGLNAHRSTDTWLESA